MNIEPLNKRPETAQNKRLASRFADFEKLIVELNKKDIPSEIANSINKEVARINAFTGTSKELKKLMVKAQSNILLLVEKELELVPKNHYRTKWLAIGMAAFGIPFGVAFGTSFGNMAFVGIGLPIGMAIGIAIGTAKDKKAEENGNQLDLEFNS